MKNKKSKKKPSKSEFEKNIRGLPNTWVGGEVSIGGGGGGGGGGELGGGGGGGGFSHSLLPFNV